MTRNLVRGGHIEFVDRRTMQQHRSAEADVVIVWLTAICGLGFVCTLVTLVPVVGQVLWSSLWSAGAVGVVAAALCWFVHRWRIRHEDRVDEILAAQWRAERADTVSRPRAEGRPARVA